MTFEVFASCCVLYLCVLYLEHFSTFEWTMYWARRRKTLAAECRSEQSGPLVLTLWTTQWYSQKFCKPLGLRHSWNKTKVQALGDILKYSVIRLLATKYKYRSQSTTRTSLEHDELAESGWRCQQLYKKTRTRVFGALLLPALLYSCETWTLTIELKRSVNFFVDTMSLRRVLRYRWHDYLSSYLCWERLGCDKSPPYFRSTNYASIGMWRDSLRRP